MDSIIRLAIAFTPMTVCLVFAGVLAYHKLPGWGWFLGISVLFTLSAEAIKAIVAG